ncbi:glutamate ligase domain-containing protein [Nonomuraea sp. 3N208]|uniref:glutamate ligase domain-containing protein n=1 Tax=Nonomuraea sp. 3N208 TaxID=3457421 RepID=UPI003FCFAD60
MPDDGNAAISAPHATAPLPDATALDVVALADAVRGQVRVRGDAGHAEQCAAYTRRTVAVLGAMGQQADASRARHAEIGRLVADLRFDVLIAVGAGDPLAMAEAAKSSNQGVAVHTAEDVAGALRLATTLLELGDVVFVKASSEIGLSACARALAGA